MSLIQDVITKVKEKDPAQPEFHQAVEEVLTSLAPTVERHPEFAKAKIYERIVEPERVIMFRVPWEGDDGEVHVNRGFRVQFNSAIGPYKGGLRFHPSVNLSIIKFLGFEQTFKNSLTTLPMGGGKGGSDFNPKGKSDREVMRFCYAFMRELYRHIGPDTDVPAGDIGVGGREIGYLYGMYKKLRNEHTGVLTGKGLEYGGSLLRPEATGYGGIYFVQEMLATQGENLQGKTAAISGFGNVAWGATQKLSQLGAKVVTLSGPDGYIYDPDGVSGEKVDYMLELRFSNNDVIEPYAEKYNEADAQNLINNGTNLVAELSNMGCTAEAIDLFSENDILFAPGKAVNAGGVATSGLEMSQNSLRLSWSSEEVDQRLHVIMKSIHKSSLDAAEAYGKPGDYVMGANIAGFLKVAKAMLAYGIV
ncbi:MAG: glutamate dehydrogenase [Anaerolineaceae bacterium 4572_5.1]|nr:MAG: glutamate dehydrogenase [Anaerolineaceae bacterium 4572_5.1]